MREFIITFGFGQKYQGGFTRVLAENYTVARMIMHSIMGTKWSMIYDSEEEAGVERFGLKEYKLEQLTPD